MPRFPDSLNLINGHVYDPRNKRMVRQNIAMHQGGIVGLGMLPDDADEDYELVDIESKVVLPYVIDLRLEQPSRFFVPESLAHALQVTQDDPTKIVLLQTEQVLEWVLTAKRSNKSLLAAVTPQFLFAFATSQSVKQLLQENYVDVMVSDDGTPFMDVFVAAALTSGCSVGALTREDLFDLITWRPRQLMGGKHKGIALLEKPSLRVISFVEGLSPAPYEGRSLQGWTELALDQGEIVFRKNPHA